VQFDKTASSASASAPINTQVVLGLDPPDPVRKPALVDGWNPLSGVLSALARTATSIDLGSRERQVQKISSEHSSLGCRRGTQPAFMPLRRGYHVLNICLAVVVEMLPVYGP